MKSPIREAEFIPIGFHKGSLLQELGQRSASLTGWLNTMTEVIHVSLISLQSVQF